MNIALWVVARVLAVASLAGGAKKQLQSPQKLAASVMGFVEDLSPGAVKAIGLVGVLLGVGLVLPALVDVLSVFVSAAAAGLGLLMVKAMITHLRRHEPQALV